jgi:hypothetical protein
MLSEWVGYLGTVDKKYIKYANGEVKRMDIQSQLDTIAKRGEFKLILHDEVEKNGLRLEDVEACIANLYSKLSAHKNGNDTSAIIRRSIYDPNQIAAIVSYLRLLNDWGFCVPWVVIDD